jgi:uncharacterized protein (TIGR00369 family)
MKLEDDGFCFACGPGNARGLKLRFRVDPEALTASTETVLDPCFNGWKGVAHGGIVTALLDETMIYACGGLGWLSVTAEISVRFRKPVPTGESIVVTGFVLESGGRFYTARAEIARNDEVLATATGRMMPVMKVDNIVDYLQGRIAT